MNTLPKVIMLILLAVGVFISNLILEIFDYGITNAFSKIIRTGDYVPFFVFLAVTSFVLILLVALFYFIKTKFENKTGVEMIKKPKKLGTSRLSTLKELNSVTGQDGLILGKRVRLSLDHSYSHYGLVGVTGSGKSSSYFINNLVLNPHASFVVTDPKGELFQKTAKENLKQGKRVLVFSPFNKDSLKYNPLALCRTPSEIRELAQILLTNGNASIEAITGQKGGGSEWINMATPLLTAVMIFVKELEPPKNTVSYALDLIIDNDIDTLKYLLKDEDPAALKQFNIFLQSSESKETASSIKTVLSTNLQIFADPMIENITSQNEIKPEMLRDKPTALYVIVPEQKSDLMSPLMAPFYSQTIGRLMEKDGVPVMMFLDEFANIGVINGIDKYLAVVRSRKISISIGIQSINQLKQRYGTDTTGTILDNLKTKAILPGSSYKTAKYFSDIIGDEEISSYSKGGDSLSESKQTRQLFSPDEIRRIPDGKILIVTDNKNPFLDNQNRYYLDENLLAKTKDTLEVDKYVAFYRKKMT